MSLTVVGFFSAGTVYEEEATILTGSLDRVGMKYLVRGFPDRGSWDLNTAAKAEKIREIRHLSIGPILYIDVDAFVHENCTEYFEGLANEGCDFAVHWFADPAGDKSTICKCVQGGACNQEHRLLSGTIFLGDTDGARRLTKAWVEKNYFLQQQGIWQGGGQKNLWKTVVEMGDTIKMARLPGRYCRVAYKPYAYPADEPVVIEHSIASRENRSGRGLVRPERRKLVAEWKAGLGL